MASTTTVACGSRWTTLNQDHPNGGKSSHTLPNYKVVQAVIETVGADLVLERLHGGKLSLIEELERQGEEIVRLTRVVSDLTDAVVRDECRP